VVISVLDPHLAWSYPQSVEGLDQHCVREPIVWSRSQRVPFVLLASLHELHDIQTASGPELVNLTPWTCVSHFPLVSMHKPPMLNMVAPVLSVVHALELLMGPIIGKHRLGYGDSEN